MKINLILLSLLSIASKNLSAQQITFNKSHLEAVNVLMSVDSLDGKAVVKVVKDVTVKKFDEPTFVKLTEHDFTNGTIELKVLSRLLKDAPEFARGFIGVTFHINKNNSKFEGIYLRPTNGRSENQLNRNHSIQYFSFPDFKFDHSRKIALGQYESYADMTLNEWITMKIEIKGHRAKLFLNGENHASLVVNDLKLGDNKGGAIGLWVDVGTEGYFSDIKISKE
ncbi:family 16 glycoside hydrolase [Pedobacter foliorum]|uniref:family 16 glycoside hydrolase n=1 Tax=Pedobacter foliorum TaxID=2739058 RepID=UPI001564F891|nr:family 16 glycoside hydrolase [Pedobacter foliorum]NRF37515.1 hypothetical protein [Pedobacter foliorum]